MECVGKRRNEKEGGKKEKKGEGKRWKEMKEEEKRRKKMKGDEMCWKEKE